MDKEAAGNAGRAELSDSLDDLPTVAEMYPHRAAQPAAQAAGLMDAQVLHRWDTHVGDPTPSRPLTDDDKLAFARAIEREVLSRAAPSGEAEYWKREAESWRRACEATEKELREARNASAPSGEIVGYVTPAGSLIDIEEAGYLGIDPGTCRALTYAAPQPSAQQAEPETRPSEEEARKHIEQLRTRATQAHEKQLADWLLTDPQTGEPLHFAGPLERDLLGLTRVRMESKSGAVWTLTAGLREGYLTASERMQNIREAATAEQPACTCGSGPARGHSWTCAAFDESMMHDRRPGLPAEETRGVALPSDDQIAATSQQICRILFGDARKVDTDIIQSHIRALLAAPAAGTGQEKLDSDLLATIRKAAETKSEAATTADGRAVFISYGDGEQQMIEAMAAACPHCGGSGHKDDVKAATGAQGLTDQALTAAKQYAWDFAQHVTYNTAETKAAADRSLAALTAILAQAAPSAAQGLNSADVKHIHKLIEVARMPNAEYVADEHNAAVRHLRALAASKEGA